MGRFVDKSAGEWVPLGACECPGTPHPDGDKAFIRTDLSGSEWATVGQGNTDRSLTIFIVEWNLLDEDGDPLLINEATVGQLDTPTFRAIDSWIGEHVTYPALPNASGAPSRNGSRASASQRRPKTR